MSKITHLAIMSAASLVLGMSLSSCATISQEKCVAQNMEDLGYKDGRNAKSRSRFGKLSESCAKYDVSLDRAAYFRGFERGVSAHCTYDNGYSRGRSGASVYSECRAINAEDYLGGHESGYEIFRISQAHSALIRDYEDSVVDLVDLRQELEKDGLTQKQIRALLREEIRLEGHIDEIRYEIRAYEKEYDLQPYRFNS